MNFEQKPFSQIKAFLSLLPRSYLWRFWGVMFSSAVHALLELVTVASVGFFAVVISEPDKMANSQWLQNAIELFPTLQQEASLVLTASGVVTTLVVIKNIYSVTWTLVVHRFAGAVQGIIGGDLFAGLLALPYQWHMKNNPSRLSLAFHNRISVGQGTIVPLMQLVSDILMVVFLVVGFITIKPLLAMIILGCVAVIGYLVFNYLKTKIDTISNHVLELQSKNYGLAHRAFVGIKDLRTSGHEFTFVKRIRRLVMLHSRSFSQRVFLVRLPVGILETLGFIILTAIVYWLFFISELNREDAIAILALLAAAAWRVLPAVGRIMSGFAGIRGSAPEVGMILELFEYIKQYPAENICEELKSEVPFDSNISLDNVSFRYDGADFPALIDIDFSISKGEMVGIIGTSGAGKSTLIDLLIGLLPPTNGKVAIDGVPLCLGNRLAWTRSIGYVAQDPYIFDGTLAENIAFGKSQKQVNRDQIIKCCQLAEIKGFLSGLPDGIDTVLGERGVRLSGGQRQRVAIARALYHKPRLLLFDEATSALDQRSERAIQRTIQAFKGKRTMIVVAHNLSTVERCDRLFWIDRGRIVASGKPEEVLTSYKEHLTKEPSLMPTV